MSNKTRKHIWPVSLLTALGIVAVLTLMAATVWMPGSAQAQSGPTNPFQATPVPGTTPTGPGSPFPTPVPGTTPTGTTVAMFKSSSTSASAGVELTFTSAKLTQADVEKIGVDGGSVELFLEDDFKVDDISPGAIYFTVTGGTVYQRGLTADGGRVRATYGVEVNDGDFFGGDDDWAIQVYLPDLYTASVDDAAGFQGVYAGQTLTMVVTKSAGITNPSEAGTHSVGYKFLGPTDDAGKDDEMDLVTNVLDDAGMSTSELATYAKIGLSDEDNVRGYELTVTGSGFNNGTTASAHVLSPAPTTEQWWNELDCKAMNDVIVPDDTDETDDPAMGTSPCVPYSGLTAAHKAKVDAASLDSGAAEAGVCQAIIRHGTTAGSALVGSDDKAAVTFEVTSPTFKPGNVNYICMKDGENRQSSTDVELFKLEPSIRVVPGEVSSGDTVTVFAQDFPNTRAEFTGLKLGGVDFEDLDPDSKPTSSGISGDGSATATFTVPGNVRGTVRVDATWGDTTKNKTIVISPSKLSLSRDAVLPNEDITITGNGFGGSASIAVADITVDNVPVQVDEDSADNDIVRVSNSGQFVATITLWPADVDSTNPTLISGTHIIRVKDSKGFRGEATVTIAEPAITVTPEIAGPRDYITITGINWPVDNPESPLNQAISITVDDGAGASGRKYSAFADNAGRFVVEHRVNRNVAIPSTNQLKAEYKDVVKVGSFATPASTIEVIPAEAQPGDMISVSATNLPVYTAADHVKIGGTQLDIRNANTGIDGSITIDNLLVPGLDPGTYSVLLDVNGTIAIGSLTVQPEDTTAGARAELPGATEALGDSLVRVFHFNGVDKSWDFYDPRDEFAELNTLTNLVNGEPYWVLVSEGQEDVVLNNKARTLTCVGGDCWNQLVW